jgi:hypothetical protein
MRSGPNSILRKSYVLIALLAIVIFGLMVAPARTIQSGHLYDGDSGTLDVPLRPGALIPPTFGPNVRANSDSTVYGQHEPSLAVSRTDPNVVVVANKDYRDQNIKRVWIEVSRDGGQTWPTQLHMPGLPATTNESDPVVIARDDGRIYVACLTTGNEGVFITWTDDAGLTWQPSVPIVQSQSSLQDKDWFAIDNNPASPFYHRMYMAWAPGGVVSSYSTNGGLNWTAPQQIPNPGPSAIEYPYPVVAPNGDVFLFHLYNWTARGTTPSIVKFVKSTNGGVSWSQPTNVATIYQPASPPRSGDNWRFYSIISAAADPSNNNRLYAAWTDNRNLNTNGMEVFYSASTDHGTTWGAITRLSHDPTGVVRDHITPMVTVGADGRVHAFWLDRRLDPSNHFFDSWYSSSTDGGATWDPDTRVSTTSQDLNVAFPPGSNNAAGDYWGLDTAGNVVYVAWNDTRTGDQDILVSRGVFGGGTATPTPLLPSPTRTSTAIASSPIATIAPPTPTGTIIAPTGTTTVPPVTSTSTTTPTSPGATSTADNTAVPASSTSTITRTAIATPSATQTVACDTGQRYADVPPENTFYNHVNYMTCLGIMSGYECGGPGEPCGQDNLPYFRPNNDITRSQLSKIVSNAAGFNEDPGAPIYADVSQDNIFYPYIQRLTRRFVLSGYPCGGPGEPCDSENTPYFRPFANATRGQISKIVANAAGIGGATSGQTFEDVSPSNTFYTYIERLANLGVMSGYPCGTIPEEPCIEPDNRPYFRPNANATRGQTSKIVANTFFPQCCGLIRWDTAP